MGVGRARTFLLSNSRGRSCLELESSTAEGIWRSAGKRLEGKHGKTSWQLAEDFDVTSRSVTPIVCSRDVDVRAFYVSAPGATETETESTCVIPGDCCIPSDSEDTSEGLHSRRSRGDDGVDSSFGPWSVNASD